MEKIEGSDASTESDCSRELAPTLSCDEFFPRNIWFSYSIKLNPSFPLNDSVVEDEVEVVAISCCCLVCNCCLTAARISVVEGEEEDDDVSVVVVGSVEAEAVGSVEEVEVDPWAV